MDGRKERPSIGTAKLSLRDEMAAASGAESGGVSGFSRARMAPM